MKKSSFALNTESVILILKMKIPYQHRMFALILLISQCLHVIQTKKTLFFAFFQPNEALFKAEMSRYGQFWFHFIIYHVEVSRNDQPGPF